MIIETRENGERILKLDGAAEAKNFLTYYLELMCENIEILQEMKKLADDANSGALGMKALGYIDLSLDQMAETIQYKLENARYEDVKLFSSPPLMVDVNFKSGAIIQLVPSAMYSLPKAEDLDVTSNLVETLKSIAFAMVTIEGQKDTWQYFHDGISFINDQLESDLNGFDCIKAKYDIEEAA